MSRIIDANMQQLDKTIVSIKRNREREKIPSSFRIPESLSDYSTDIYVNVIHIIENHFERERVPFSIFIRIP